MAQSVVIRAFEKTSCGGFVAVSVDCLVERTVSESATQGQVCSVFSLLIPTPGRQGFLFVGDISCFVSGFTLRSQQQPDG